MDTINRNIQKLYDRLTEDVTCLLCKEKAKGAIYAIGHFNTGINYFFYRCQICGDYAIENILTDTIREGNLFSDIELITLSCLTRRATESSNALRFGTEDEIRTSIASCPIPTNPLEGIDNILIWLFERINYQNDFSRIFAPKMYPLFFARSFHEFNYWIEKAIQHEYLEHKFILGGTTEDQAPIYRLTLKGWDRVKQLKENSNKLSRSVFIAMSFHNDTDAIFLDGIKPALEATGYSGIQLKFTAHNGQIDNKIVSEIRKSRFVVSEFTLPDKENRQYTDPSGKEKYATRDGIYFECGFAQGLGIEVIRTCRIDQKEELHFDVDHYSVIFWTDIPDLQKKLTNWIEATII